jgi:hypothetical protein
MSTNKNMTKYILFMKSPNVYGSLVCEEAFLLPLVS